MKKNKVLIWILIAFILGMFLIENKEDIADIEDKEISAGIGIDFIKQGEDNYLYSISDNIYFFIEDKEVTSDVFTGIASTIGKTRDDRASKLPKEFFLGQSKLFIFDELVARKSIRPTIDILFNNSSINDNAYCIVCKGTSKTKLQHNINGIASASEYMEGMIRHIENFNFFKNTYKLRDVFLSIDSEGRNCILPYIELQEDGLKITGVAIFNKDKLVRVMDIKDTRILNILRNKSAKGILSIKRSENEYVDYYGISKRKIECIKKDDKYKFSIQISFIGDIVSNSLYKDIDSKTDVVKKFEEDMAQEIESECSEFIESMKKTSNVDCLELGRVAAAKYGRDTGVDWNEIVCNSEIEVKVKVKVDKVGRGQY